MRDAVLLSHEYRPVSLKLATHRRILETVENRRCPLSHIFGGSAGRCGLCRFRPSGDWLLYTDMRSILFVTLGFIFPLHFIKRITCKPTRGLNFVLAARPSAQCRLLNSEPIVETARKGFSGKL
jgi:hypothetical protein